ncbi:MAG: A/G-specific adenine glycosylase, partial [Salinibacterium sp.]
ASFAYGRRHPVVDTNVRRVIARAVAGVESTASSKRDLAAMEALLPESEPDAQLTNAAMMELGALVCTARAPRCEACPLAVRCRWRAASYPAPGVRARAQKKYEGSDRQVRGVILAALRATGIPISISAIEALWPDATQRSRALDSLIVDGLVEVHDGEYALPR